MTPEQLDELEHLACWQCRNHLRKMRRDVSRFDWLPRKSRVHAFSQGQWGHKSVCGWVQR